ncbi:MAG: hypothetical protein ACLGHA_03990 [Gammaproteobacteria bacterium]
MNRVVTSLILACCVSQMASAAHYLRDDERERAEWKVIRTVTGDLNSDGTPDTVSVGEEVNRKNFKKNDGYGEKVLNVNPRDLVIMFRTRSGGRGKTFEINQFLPSEHSVEEPCLSDPLEGGEGVQIVKGILEISLQYWYSCGSWGVSATSFKFRYEQGRFRLIGLEESSHMRNSGDATASSTNFLTGKKKIITENVFDPSVPQKVSWKKLAGNRFYYLDEMTPECVVSKKGQDWCK